MLTDKALADLCAETYKPSHVASFATDDVHLSLTKLDGILYWAFRGSASPEDWWDDFKALPTHRTVDHADLGLCHGQFLDNALSALAWLEAQISAQPHVGTGHSKGADEAIDAAVLLSLRGKPPLKLSVFAPARGGALNGLLRAIPGASYRWQDDPVPMVPIWLPHARPLTYLGQERFELDCIGDHGIANYQAQAPTA